MARSPSGGTQKGTVRCAIYTRKSSEEGLEQDFNSLAAQREACEAFIKSQKHEGWELDKTLYDDGGFSGGTIERPALKRLLEDIKACKVHVIVVYKVDRLTRSLADFAKIVEVLDAQGASFVSITQQFNTTTSMGRLTLNVLLSFAQFEREVTGERIRDKIAASKRKGMWMGGLPPLGYDIQDRKLVINTKEATIVRRIYQRYLALASVRALKQELDAEGVISKLRPHASGRWRGGKLLARGALYRILQNRIYLGEIVHKDKSYPGEHKPIIEKMLFDQVQQRLKQSGVERGGSERAANQSLLTGLLFDEAGSGMTPTHAVKRGTRYRYYVSRSLLSGPRRNAAEGRRIPAGDIETLVIDRLRSWLSQPAGLITSLKLPGNEILKRKKLVDKARQLSEELPASTPLEQRTVILSLVSRVDLLADQIRIHIRSSAAAALLARASNDALDETLQNQGLVLSVPAHLKRVGMEMKLIIEGHRASEPDAALVKLMTNAQSFYARLVEGDFQSIDAMATHEGVTSSYITRVLRLAFLAPDIMTAIIHGQHPPQLNASKLVGRSRLPLDWMQQRTLLGFR